MPDSPEQPIITALPDISSTPSQAKKPKLDPICEDSQPHQESSVEPSSTTPSSHPDLNSGNVKVPSGLDDISLAGPSSPPDILINGEATALDPENGCANDGTPAAATAVPLPDIEGLSEAKEEVWWDLKMSWSGKIYDMRVGGSDMVYDFRAAIESLTSVPADRQKLIGLSKGKLSVDLDSKRFATLGVKHGTKFTMIGTPEELRFKDPSEIGIREVADDFDVTYPEHVASKKAVAPADDPRNRRKVMEMIQKYPITIMNEPRPGRKLLVLDLDYTIVDTKPLIAGSLPSDECARPGLHEFLELVYPYYDIVIWSQTSWRWLESKLVELGIIGGDRNYKICFVADRGPMFPVFTQRNGQPYKHEVKPLAYFWASYPQWSAKNTVHIDDLARNFALNPGEGLRIRAYNTAGTMEGMMDRELTRLGSYLLHLAENVSDFTTVDHSKWKGNR